RLPAAPWAAKLKGSPATTWRVIFTHFQDAPFTFKEFFPKRGGAESTARLELNQLEDLGLIRVDKSGRRYHYEMQSEIRALSRPQMEAIAAIPAMNHYWIDPRQRQQIRRQ